MATRNVSEQPSLVRPNGAQQPTTDLRDGTLRPAEHAFMFHYAALYLERGFSVIPLVGKRPAVAWAEFQTRRPTCDELHAWFGSAANGNFNVGIVTGRVSDLVVVDCDSPDTAKFWKEHFPATPLVSTTGRGQHFYYRTPRRDAVRNQARVLGGSIDLRGEGGYVVAPPSRHPVAGVLYQWRPWGHYSLDEIPVFDATWLTHASAEHSEEERSRLRRSNGRKRAVTPQEILRLAQRLDFEVADRSARDFAILCELVRAGLKEVEIRPLVMRRSKFKTNGEAYFRRTYDNAKRAVGS